MNETRYRDAELRVWKSFGLVPTDRQLLLERTNTSIRVQNVGSGPPVILIHGSSNSGTSWAPLVAGLREFRCVIVDRPGCGLSEPLNTTFDDIARFEAFADGFVADILDSLELDRAGVVTTSFGSYLGLRSAAAHLQASERRVRAHAWCWPRTMDG